jgi:hypothetical protein
MELGKFKVPSLSNNYLIWIIVAFVVLGFGKSSNTLGFSFFGTPNLNDTHKSSRKHYSDSKSCEVAPVNTIFPNVPFLGNQRNGGGFLGGNGLFLIAIVAILFLCKDDKKGTYNDTAAVDYGDIEN